MAKGERDIMAQAVYLAQMEAEHSKCKCRTCLLLRKGNKMMADQFLGITSENPGNPLVAGLQTLSPEEEE